MKCLPVVLAVCLVSSLAGYRCFASGSLNADFVFFEDPNQEQTRMTIAFDGTDYWSVSGGGTFGIRQSQYSIAGAFVADYAPGLDFRSNFTDVGGNLYGRQYDDPTIYIQTSPGVFAPYVVLAGGVPDAQSGVVLNGAGTEYIAFSSGTLSRWDLTGNLLPSIAFAGYGTLGSESLYPQNRGVAAVGNAYLTYSDGVLSTWDAAGNRIDTTTLVDAGQSFDSYFSISYTNGHVWVVDGPGGSWKGYSYSPDGAVPEPSSLALAGIGSLVALGVARCRASRCKNS